MITIYCGGPGWIQLGFPGETPRAPPCAPRDVTTRCHANTKCYTSQRPLYFNLFDENVRASKHMLLMFIVPRLCMLVEIFVCMFAMCTPC